MASRRNTATIGVMRGLLGRHICLHPQAISAAGSGHGRRDFAARDFHLQEGARQIKGRRTSRGGGGNESLGTTDESAAQIKKRTVYFWE